MSDTLVLHDSDHVGDLVPREGRGQVVGAHRHGIHLRWHTDVWTVVVDATDDVYPWGVRVRSLPPGITADAHATVQDGVLRVGDAAIRIAPRHADDHEPLAATRRPVVDPAGWLEARPQFHRLVRGFVERLDPLDRRVWKRHSAALREHPIVDRVEYLEASVTTLGAGTGLTPFGDDLIVGGLAAWSSVDPTHRATPSPHFQDTTDLSGWLLAMATVGRFGQTLTALAGAAAGNDVAALHRHLQRISRLGSSSGVGMALGVALGFDTIISQGGHHGH